MAELSPETLLELVRAMDDVNKSGLKLTSGVNLIKSAMGQGVDKIKDYYSEISVLGKVFKLSEKAVKELASVSRDKLKKLEGYYSQNLQYRLDQFDKETEGLKSAAKATSAQQQQIDDLTKARGTEREEIKRQAEEASKAGDSTRGLKDGLSTVGSKIFDFNLSSLSLAGVLVAAIGRIDALATATAQYEVAGKRATGTLDGMTEAQLNGITGIKDLGEQMAIKTEDMLAFESTILSAPGLLKSETAKSFSVMTGYALTFGMSMDGTAKLLAQVSQSFGGSSEDVADAFRASMTTTQGLNMTIDQNVELLINMADALQAVGGGISDAYAISKDFVGLDLPGNKVKEFAQSIASVVSNMSPSKIAGYMMFARGQTSLPNFKQVQDAGKNSWGLLKETFAAMKRQSGVSKDQEYLLVETINKSMGLVANTVQGTGALMSILEKNITDPEAAMKIIADAGAMAERDMLNKGIEQRAKMIGPLENIQTQIQTIIDDYLKPFLPIADGVSELAQHSRTARNAVALGLDVVAAPFGGQGIRNRGVRVISRMILNHQRATSTGD